MALRVVLDKLEHGKYRTAFVTNPDLTFPQLMREIIGQLQDELSQIRSREALLERFNRCLFEAADSGQKVLLFIDEGQALRGPVLESMRLLTSIQENKRNLLTIILAGQPELGTMLTAPKRANLLQRVGVCPILEPLGSEDLVGDYIDHRMERAGSTRNVFTNSGIAAIYESSKGVPRIINRFCKLSLKAGETNRLDEIDAKLVNTIANQFQPSRLLQGLADARGGKETGVQQNPNERPADHNAEELPQNHESIPESATHPIPGSPAVEPERGMSVRARLDEEPPDQDNKTESLTQIDQNVGPENESLDTGPRIEKDHEPLVAPEEPLASHSVEKVSSSLDSIPESESLPSEDTHAIKSDCRVSVRPQPDEPPYQELGLDPDGDSCDRGIEPDTDGLDTAARIEADPPARGCVRAKRRAGLGPNCWI